jgi:hypothetical protein
MRVPMLWANQSGPLASVFCDAATDKFASNPQRLCRLDCQQVVVGHATKVSEEGIPENPGKPMMTVTFFLSSQESPRMVMCVNNHGLHSGDVVAINGQTFFVEVVSDHEFNAVAVSDPVGADAAEADLDGHIVELVSRNSDADSSAFVSRHCTVAVCAHRIQVGSGMIYNA